MRRHNTPEEAGKIGATSAAGPYQHAGAAANLLWTGVVRMGTRYILPIWNHDPRQVDHLIAQSCRSSPKMGPHNTKIIIRLLFMNQSARRLQGYSPAHRHHHIPQLGDLIPERAGVLLPTGKQKRTSLTRTCGGRT